MKRYIVTFNLNVSHRGGMFRGFNEGAVMMEVSRRFIVEAEEPGNTLNLAYRLGNKMGGDSDGEVYPEAWRSVSVGDVIAVRSFDPVGGETADYYAVEPVGFAPVNRDSFVLLVEGDARVVKRNGDLQMPFRERASARF